MNQAISEEQASEQEKRDWVCEHYNGSWELWINPVAIYDRISELEDENQRLRIQLEAELKWRRDNDND